MLGDATVDSNYEQGTFLVCMMLTVFGCKFIFGGVLGSFIIIWGISSGRLGSVSNCNCGWVMLISIGFSPYISTGSVAAASAKSQFEAKASHVS